MISAAICTLAMPFAATVPAPANAIRIPERTLIAGDGFRVVEVIDGDTVALDDGSEVRLVGLQAPKLALGRPDFEDWPLADEAKASLETLVLERDVLLFFGGRRMDRHGRHLAHLVCEGTWVQGALLELGMARVYSFVDNRALAAEMLALEIAARAAGRGIWAENWYAVRAVDGLEGAIDSFQLVEGTALSAARVKGRGYLNFGADWKSDFTLSLDEDALRLFDAEGVAIGNFEGRRLRSRGWVESFNGPMIEITHPEQIEVVDE